MTTERTYHDLTIAELRELALKNASPHTSRHERELSSMMLGHAMLAVLPHIAELEADNARLHAIAEQATGNAVRSARTVLEVEAQLRYADNLITLQTAALRAARRLVLAFDVGDVAHTTLNGRGYAALAELRTALEETRDESY